MNSLAIGPNAAWMTDSDTPPRHVVVMRPGSDPAQGLRDGIDRAARALGHDAALRRSLRQSGRTLTHRRTKTLRSRRNPFWKRSP